MKREEQRRGELEETVLEKLERLVGAPRITYINKWRRFMLDIIPSSVDPHTIWGSDLKDDDDVIEVLEEHCEDLTESECKDKLLTIAKGVVRTGKTSKDYIEFFERESRFAEMVSKKLGLDVMLEPHTAKVVYDCIQRYDINCILEEIRTHLTRYYERDPVEVDAELRRVRMIVEEQMKKMRPVDWRSVLEPVIREPEDIYPWLRRWTREYGRVLEQADKFIEANKDKVILYIGSTLREIADFRRIAEVKAFKDMHITNWSELLDAIRESRIAKALGLKAVETITFPRFDVQAAAHDRVIYYDIEPLACYVYQNKYVVRCNQPVIMLMLYYQNLLTYVI